MQSTNEELTTVNDELQNRMTELSQTNDDLHNVLAGVDNAVVIVGMDLRIRRYTGAAEKLFNLVPGDVGRTVGFLDPFLGASATRAEGVHRHPDSLDARGGARRGNHRWYALKISSVQDAGPFDPRCPRHADRHRCPQARRGDHARRGRLRRASSWRRSVIRC